MTAPDTNIEKQVNRHYPALYGIAAVLLAVLGFIFLAPMSAEDQAAPATVTTTATE